tara:strand:+ start:3951 stop:6452 length:2502 start_codon:yes stop_codon:yes gene_type:complete
MAIFTAIATAIVGAIGITGFAATLATSIIAGGLALGTAKVLGVFKPPQVGSSRDPGVKIQLPPATDNKIPVMYGRNYTGAIIVDAGISNQNKTMTYVMVLSEKTDSGTYSVTAIYRDDQQLVFGSGASSHIVQSVIDPNATSSASVAGKLRCRIYAGGTAASNQIFPVGNTVAATTLLPTITGSTNYSGLIYAVFEIDYDTENNLTGLGAITYDITNTLSEPSNVILDYCLNSRYGAGLSSNDLETSGFDELFDYSTEQVAYITPAGAGATQNRWQIDGMLSTYGSVRDNISTLCQSCSTFFTYNPKVGKFTVVPNRAATTAEKANAFVFTQDNIVSSMEITSTELYSTINEIEAEYPLVSKKDQTDVLFINTPASSRNPSEPDNKLTTRYSLVNDTPRVHNLANIDLRQSRVSTVVKFDADYSAIQVDVGDVVKINNISPYGFANSLYRVMQVSEQQSQDGMLSTNVIALQYADYVYDHANVQSGANVGLSGISGWWIGNSNTIPTYGNVVVNDNPLQGNANVVNAGNGSVVGTVDFANISLPTIGGFGTPFIEYPLIIPDDSNFDELYVNVKNNDIDSNVSLANSIPTEVKVTPPNGNASFVAGEEIRVPINIPFLGVDTSYTVATLVPKANIIADAYLRDSKTGANSQTASTANIFVQPRNFTNNQNMTVFGAGVQLEDAPAAANIVSSTTFSLIGGVKQEYSLEGAEIGDYSLDSYATLAGVASTAFDVGFRNNTTLQFANTTSTANVELTPGESEIQNITQFPPQLTAATKIVVDPAAYGLPADMKPSKAFVGMDGYSDVGEDIPGGFPRQFGNRKFNLTRTTKGERE